MVFYFILASRMKRLEAEPRTPREYSKGTKMNDEDSSSSPRSDAGGNHKTKVVCGHMISMLPWIYIVPLTNFCSFLCTQIAEKYPPAGPYGGAVGKAFVAHVAL